MVGLNHGCWGVEHDYDGQGPLPLLEEAWERRRCDTSLEPRLRRQLQLAVAMGTVPADYFEFYYFTDEVLAELQAKPTTRAEDILGWSSDYWSHYAEQAQSDDPQLDPSLSRGGIHELELAIDVMDAIFNDKDETHPVNMPNAGGALPGFPDDLVVEVLGRCHVRRHRRRSRRPRSRGTFVGWWRCSASTRRSPPRRRGTAPETTACERLARTHSCARSKLPSASTTRSQRRTTGTCPPGCCRCRGRIVASLLLGVDGGNTKTVALVVEADGTVVGSGRGGCGGHPQRELTRARGSSRSCAPPRPRSTPPAPARRTWRRPRSASPARTGPKTLPSCDESSTERLGLRDDPRDRQRCRRRVALRHRRRGRGGGGDRHLRRGGRGATPAATCSISGSGRRLDWCVRARLGGAGCRVAAHARPSDPQ